MSATLNAVHLAANSEPIPGYVLQERIGVGGYGEVWRATAPGGLVKAVKIVYGQLEEMRAAREFKSLSRAKELSHPFLLSLERIEVVDGYLVIVREMADSSLQDRFEECRDTGLPGVPRNELLGYMREAADALDYLFESNSLQHLDVKPENLLLLRKHIKVADFGLLKDLQEGSASLVNGLTPKFSPPELFHGNPSRHSDQYSLAIVYQQMLTGQFPFDGRNAATLASQHLHCAPDLSSLTPLERFAVGKAMSKDPHQRFGSCREFVERLAHRNTATLITQPQPTPAADRKRPRDTREQASNSIAALPRHDGQTVVVAPPEVTSLPALQLETNEVAYRPTIVIGIGGTGGKVLCRLRQSIADQFGSLSAMPAVQILYIDTDVASIDAVAKTGDRGTLAEHETLLTPLRQTRDYRSHDLANLKSISRRWIYNIPRSGRTEGLRALGRLALLDHSTRVLERLRKAVLAATDREAIAETSRNTGLKFVETDPRVLVVASIAGGTGGGMVVDVAYAVRQILAECGLSDDEVSGLLAYSSCRGSNNSLAPVNAFACLDELRYFSMPGTDYPGEPGCGLAGFQEDAPTFKSTYLVDLGDDLSDDDFNEATDRMADYVLLNSISPASVFFDACRRSERETPNPNGLQIRSARICSLAVEDREVTSQWVEFLCKCVVRKWRGGIDSATTEERIKLSEFDRLFEACVPQAPFDEGIEQLSAQQVADHGLQRNGILKRIDRMIETELGAAAESYFQSIISESLDKPLADVHRETSSAGIALQTIQAVVGSDESRETERDHKIESLREVILPKARVLGSRIGEALGAWILGLVDTANARVAGARQAGDWITRHLQTLQSSALAELRAANEQLHASTQTALEACGNSKSKRRTKRAALAELLLDHAKNMTSQLRAEALCKTIAAIEPHVTSSMDQLRDLWKNLNQLTDAFHLPRDWGDRHADATQHRLSPAGLLCFPDVYGELKQQMIESLDRALEQHCFNRNLKLRQVLTAGSHAHSNLIVKMRAAARNIVLQVNRHVRLLHVNNALTNGADAGFAESLRKCLVSAEPRLLAAGGSKRLLLVTPKGLDGARLQQEVERISQDEATQICDPKATLAVCYEAEQLRLDRIQARLLRRRPDCQELAPRLHTRIDVAWRVV